MNFNSGKRIVEVRMRREDDDYGLTKMAGRIMDLIQEQDFADMVFASSKPKGNENEMNLNEAFPSKYLKAADIGSRARNVVIKNVTMEEVGQKKDKRLVASFNGLDKGLVLNKTNAKRIANISGSQDTDDWRGTKIALKSELIEFQGETMQGIRVSLPEQGQPEPMPTDSSDDSDLEPDFD